MKEGWELLTIKECCDILDSRRKPITKSKRDPGAIPYYGATGLLDYVKDYIFDEPLVLLGEDGAKWGAGECSAYRIEGKSWVNNHAHALRPKRDIVNDYWLIYFLNYSNLQSYITGVTVPKLNQEKMCSITLPAPPLSEQQRIVDYLDSAFAKIDAMKANAEKSLNEAKALFQASLKEMLEPKEGWEDKKVKDLSLLITKGSSPKWQGNSYVNSEGILFVTSENVREGCIEFNPAKFVDNSFNIKQRRSILKKFDVLVNIVGASIGRAAIFDLDVENANINQAVCLIRLNWDKILPTYLCFFLNSDYAFKQYASMVKEAARANLSLENIGSLEIGIPSLSEQQSIVATLDSLKSKVDRLQVNYDKISQECDALKQAILRQVFE